MTPGISSFLNIYYQAIIRQHRGGGAVHEEGGDWGLVETHDRGAAGQDEGLGGEAAPGV